jgi:hypothetical protein
MNFKLIKKKQKKNSTNFLGGRFGNHFFYSMVLHIISQQNNLLTTYKEYNNLNKLGINLFVGTKTYDKVMYVTDSNFQNFLFNHGNSNVILDGYFQTKEFALYLYDYFRQDIKKNKIIEHNIYKNRYQHNNDVFIHVRLGDILNTNNEPYQYYDTVLSSITFDKGYISSDSINDSICKELINKYNLEIINFDIIPTIMFGSTCRNVILSKGSFSWLIGILSFYSNVYYPSSKYIWHGDIFVIPEWTKINYNII